MACRKVGPGHQAHNWQPMGYVELQVVAGHMNALATFDIGLGWDKIPITWLCTWDRRGSRGSWCSDSKRRAVGLAQQRCQRSAGVEYVPIVSDQSVPGMALKESWAWGEQTWPGRHCILRRIPRTMACYGGEGSGPLAKEDTHCKAADVWSNQL